MFFFVFKSALLGTGLAMDAFSVSIANALQNPGMRRRKAWLIAGTFAFFQFLMPMVGWVCVHTISEHFLLFQKAVPYIAFGLLALIGGKMVLEGIRGGEEEEESAVSGGTLFIQGIATSIDALSVGFTIANYTAAEAFSASVIIAVTTFLICQGGIRIGKFFGMKLAGRAAILGGIILLGIGLRILLGGGF